MSNWSAIDLDTGLEIFPNRQNIDEETKEESPAISADLYLIAYNRHGQMIQTNFGSYAEDVDEQDGIKHLDDPEENKRKKIDHAKTIESLDDQMFTD